MERAGLFQGVGHAALPCSTVALNGHNRAGFLHFAAPPSRRVRRLNPATWILLSPALAALASMWGAVVAQLVKDAPHGVFLTIVSGF